MWGPGQGPPGTGKTSAIVALVSALCATRRAAPAAAGAGRLADGAPAGAAAHVLVCAQSNAAVDELVVRLAAHSTSDGQQAGCVPSLLLGMPYFGADARGIASRQCLCSPGRIFLRT